MPKVVDHDQYRKELLQGCMALFAERGYGSITMRQIAKGLSVSTGTLYHYFPSKESLFMQLMNELREQALSNFFAQAPREGSIEARLQALMDFVLQDIQYHHQQLRLFVDFSRQSIKGSKEEARFLCQLRDHAFHILTDYLQVSDPRVVDFILVFIDGLILQLIYDRDVHDTKWFEQHCQLLIQMVIRHEQHNLETKT